MQLVDEGQCPPPTVHSIRPKCIEKIPYAEASPFSGLVHRFATVSQDHFVSFLQVNTTYPGAACPSSPTFSPSHIRRRHSFRVLNNAIVTSRR
jgi:hypothetical protein